MVASKNRISVAFPLLIGVMTAAWIFRAADAETPLQMPFDSSGAAVAAAQNFAIPSGNSAIDPAAAANETPWAGTLPATTQNLAPAPQSLPSQPSPMFPAGPSLASAGDMIGFSRELAGGSQAITLINTARRWMAVYHVDQAGQIRLVSSRPLEADFSFQFNATSPLPEEIRRLKGG
jgi:hypothetical protein